MSTREGIDTKVLTALGEDKIYPFFAVKGQFDSGTVRLWTGTEDITIDSETYTGAGSLLSMTGVEENSDLASTNLIVTLSGMDQTVLNLALSENYQNRRIDAFLGFLDGGTNEVKGKMNIFGGRMTQMTISDSAQGSQVTINSENRLVDLDRPSNLRYNRGSQQFLDSTDTAFRHVQENLEVELIWGRDDPDPSSNAAAVDPYGSYYIGGLF